MVLTERAHTASWHIETNRARTISGKQRESFLELGRLLLNEPLGHAALPVVGFPDSGSLPYILGKIPLNFNYGRAGFA